MWPLRGRKDIIMKRMITFALAVIAIFSTLVFAGCGEPFTCDLCGEEKTGKKHTEELLGQEITYCDECYKGLEELGQLFE